MNVKISSRLKQASLVVALIALFIAALMYVPNNKNALDCTADIILELGKGDDTIDADIHLVVHFEPEVQSYITEYGVVNYDNKRYIIDRYARLRYSRDDHHSFVEFKREGLDKNSAETLPDALSEKLTSAQKVFLFKVRKLHDDIWSISDLRRTVLVCAKSG
ncbi:hypothetical protein N2K86_04440 [Enterobacter mori]|uniref:hypothetical protein n=1 Tax=Enterobacter mori TaxID=539813 RepID=UPI0021B0F8F3|nr:hypothetical protein [Enterobacter mori]UWX94199.1 hypothetical protein N2K86_04440 [Enterobacter mori]